MVRGFMGASPAKIGRVRDIRNLELSEIDNGNLELDECERDERPGLVCTVTEIVAGQALN
jgi:hypothetical protein